MVVFISLVTAAFFYQTVIFGKLPVPSDALVGLYHPYRDVYSAQYPNGIPFKNFLITDPVRQQIPWRKQAVEYWKNGVVPSWDAWSFSGTTLIGNIQTGAFYPLNILFFIFSFPVVWSLLIISQPLLCGIFLYLFLRNKRLEILPSLVGAVSFMFCGFSVAWLTWGTIVSTWAWAPLALLAVDKLHDQGIQNKNTWRFLFILSIICSFFAGHLQIFLYSVIFISTYAVWMRGRQRLSGIPLVHVGVVLGITLITFPVWFSMIRWLPATSRLAQGAVWTHEGFFIPLRHLIQFFVPDYFGNPTTLNYWGVWNYGEMVGYIGIAGLLLAALGVSSQTLFWVVMIVFSLLFAVDSPIAQLPFRMHVPILSTLQPTRLLVVVDFCLAVLSAYGLSYVLKKARKKSVVIAAFVVGVVLLGLWISVLFPGLFAISVQNVLVAKRNMILPTILYVFVVVILFVLTTRIKTKKEIKLVLGGVIVLVMLFDIFRFGWKFTPFIEERYFYPQTQTLILLQTQAKPFRIMATDDRILPPNVNEYYGIESVAGYDPIHTGRYEEYIAAMERGTPDIKPPFGYERIMAPKNIHSPLFQLLNVRYVLSFDDLTKDGFKPVIQEGETKVFENMHVIPRVYWAKDVVYKSDKQAVMDALYDPAFIPGESAVIENPVDVLNIPLSSSETVNIEKYKSNELHIRVSTANTRLLVIGNMFDDGWRAMVDDKSSKIFRTNYIFMGLVIPEGNHEIYLRYL